jgi:hypothetical protein
MYEILTGKAAFPSSGFVFPIVKQILRGKMPAVPDECGSLMQRLIQKCWTMDPGKRPSVEEILREFKSAKFQIVPDADPVKVGLYTEEIEGWEAKEANEAKDAARKQSQ